MVNSKAKGGAYERKVCRALSGWVSHGAREDLFWRSSISGGRATVGKRKGRDLRYQAGDISAVHPDGHVLTDYWYIEAKAYRNLQFEGFFLGIGSRLHRFWQVAKREAASYDRQPMLIAKQNNWPTIVLIPTDQVDFHYWAEQSKLAEVFLEEATVLSFEKIIETNFESYQV